MYTHQNLCIFSPPSRFSCFWFLPGLFPNCLFHPRRRYDRKLRLIRIAPLIRKEVTRKLLEPLCVLGHHGVSLTTLIIPCVLINSVYNLIAAMQKIFTLYYQLAFNSWLIASCLVLGDGEAIGSWIGASIMGHDWSPMMTDWAIWILDSAISQLLSLYESPCTLHRFQ